MTTINPTSVSRSEHSADFALIAADSADVAASQQIPDHEVKMARPLLWLPPRAPARIPTAAIHNTSAARMLLPRRDPKGERPAATRPNPGADIEDRVRVSGRLPPDTGTRGRLDDGIACCGEPFKLHRRSARGRRWYHAGYPVHHSHDG